MSDLGSSAEQSKGIHGGDPTAAAAYGGPTQAKPVVIVGAGISGLLLAQRLRRGGIPFELYERDEAFAYRGVGWGLTLHWSLPALRQLLPDELFARLPEAYVDRQAVAHGEVSAFPFFDLATGELRAATPKAPESERVRVSRDKLRKLLATAIDVRWGKTFRAFEAAGDGVIVRFEDGSSADGCLLVACDGTHSRVRRALLPERYRAAPLPVGIMGARVDFKPERIEPLRKLDAFFLQGACSSNDTFLYFSVLDAPANSREGADTYSCQICVSWPLREGFFGSKSPIPVPETNAARLELARLFARTWAEPFSSLVLDIPEETELKRVTICDWPPSRCFSSTGRVALMGDAFHAMSMYRGEGANHAIVDVLDFAERVVPHLRTDRLSNLREAIGDYEDAVVGRARPAVFASRRACLDAHEWARITERSPLLTKRAAKLDYVEEGD